MPPRLKLMIAIVAFDLTLALYDLLGWLAVVPMMSRPFGLAAAIFLFGCIARLWPQLQREWRAWWNGDG